MTQVSCSEGVMQGKLCMLSWSSNTYVVALQCLPPRREHRSHHLLPSRLWPPPQSSPLLWQCFAGVSPSIAAADAAAVEACLSALRFAAAAAPLHALLDDTLAPPAASGCQVCPAWQHLHVVAHSETVS